MKSKDNTVSFVKDSRLELIGNGRCVVDGLKGIEIYNSDKIKVNLGKYYVTFFGDNLFINAFSPEGAIVEGTIISLEFESNG
ncbi:MAG: YabP/YqfC family sporulation protein [Eubacterium sp.]|nr:YabP/YqfC family sporulation protein [Eubacterium sp.]